MQLETGSLIIRAPTLDDLPFIIAVREDPVLRRFTSWPRPGVDLHQWAQDYLERAVGVGPGDKPYPYIMEDKASEKQAGELTVMFNEPGPMQAEIGYTLTHGFHGRGLVVEGLSALITHILETFPLHRLMAQADTRNAASIRILEKLGFRLEGVHKSAYWKEEEWSDKCVYALLREEWRWPR